MNAIALSLAAGAACLATAHASADFMWTNIERELWIDIGDDIDSYGDFDSNYTDGFWESTISASYPSSAGFAEVTAIQSSEFFSDGFSGSMSMLTDTSDPLPPDLVYTLGFNDVDASATFDSAVEVRIQYEAGEQLPTSVASNSLSFAGVQYNGSVDTVVMLDAGTYDLRWEYSGFAIVFSPGIAWESSSSLTLTIVPSPSTIAPALLVLVGTARRRR